MDLSFFKPTLVDVSDSPQVYMNLFANNSKSFKFISEWNVSTIRIYVVNNENILTANVKKLEFEPQANKLKLKLDDYLKELQLIFSKNKPNYVASISESQFSIKRILNEEDEMCEKFCDINLSKVRSNDILSDISNLMLKAFYYQRNEIEFQREQSERLKKEQQESTQKLKEAQTAWEVEKRDLKCKFLLLLNEKKDRILELRDLLEDYMQTKSNNYTKSSSKSATKRKQDKSYSKIEDNPEKINHNSSPDNIPDVYDDNSNDSLVDESNLAALQSLPTTTVNEPQPSTSKLTAYKISTKVNLTEIDCTKISDEDSDNLLGESQEAPIIEAKRNRREENVDPDTKKSIETRNKMIANDEVIEENNEIIENSFNLDDYLSKMRN